MAKKKVISNIEIESKYSKQRKKLKKKAEELLKLSQNAQEKLSKLEDSLEGNTFNQKLLRKKMAKITTFNSLISEAWNQSFGMDEEADY